MLPLFAYGTLRDPELQQELFARTYPLRNARLTGYAVVSTAGGYVAAIPRAGSTIDGVLVELDAAGYAIADGWEDLTVYDRIEAVARDDDEHPRTCFLYVQPAARGADVVDARVADRPRAEVLADIRRFRAGFNLRADGEQG